MSIECLTDSALYVVVGVFCFSCAYFNWDWFMNHRKAQSLMKILKINREQLRKFYMFLGIFILVVAGGISIISGFSNNPDMCIGFGTSLFR